MASAAAPPHVIAFAINLIMLRRSFLFYADSPGY
jgi:hypothetical protein